MKLLHVMSSIDPRAGGPREGVLQRGVRLLQMGHVVEVVTLDDPKESFLAQFPLKAHALGPSRGGYRYNAGLIPWLKSHAGDYDAVIVNGMWQYNGLAVWRALRGTAVPYYVFTHGMLDPWFKHAYPLKHLKKWLYWPWAEYRILRDAQAVLFTSEEERLMARQSFWLYRVREKVVAYGTAAPTGDQKTLQELFLASYPQLQGCRILLYLGRIHEKKGCDLLIQAFARAAMSEPRLHLVMAGPDQTGWAAQLKTLAQDHGVAGRVSWPGMLRGRDKWAAFYSAEAFVLPSHQENFGIAVAEALACGLPVLISNKVNIWREIEADNAGLIEPDTLLGTQQLLVRWLGMDLESRRTMSRSARDCFERRFTVDAMAASLLSVVETRAA